ncbi:MULTISPECIES: DUF2946 family protein [unclassified Variovorax]|uniref:DUF2946 family protein n=1 Tax=unclassified Variovorax TaxID=663243 RepID=UPI003ED00164
MSTSLFRSLHIDADNNPSRTGAIGCFARLAPFMRRILYIVLMLLLPLQWSWASAASVCAHEDQGQATHFGHHEHAHQGAAHADEQKGDSQAGSLADHPDCGVCHGLSSAVIPASDNGTRPPAYRIFYVPYASAVPDRFVETLLRPPLTLVS